MGLTINRFNCPVCSGTAIRQVLACKDYTVTGETFGIMECDQCSLRFTQAVPGQENIGKYYASEAYISHSDTGKGLINRVYKMARGYTLGWKMKMVRKYASVNSAGSLLDIGAGTGAFLQYARGRNWKVTGLEPDAGARKLALGKYGLELRPAGELTSLPGASFDLITMWHVLEHVHELHEYITEIHRLLTPGGAALVALPNYTSMDAAIYGQHWAAYDVPRHLYHFSPASMKRLVQQHGFEISATRPMWLDAFYICMLSEKYKYGRNRLVPAFLNGIRSNLHAWTHTPTCSSQVYVIRKIEK